MARAFLTAGILLAALCSCGTPGPTAPPPTAPAAPAQAAYPEDPDELLKAARQAYGAGDFARGLELVKRVLEASPDKVTAYDRIGSVYLALGRGAEALGMWESALAMEKDEARRTALASSVALTRRSLGLPEPPPAKPSTKKPARPAKRPAAKKPAAAPKTDKEAAQEAYRQGLDRYAAGEYLAATTLFLEALDFDPTHEGARKALERLKLRPAR